ncbi:MAG: hypothetical protein IPO72_01080 [Saprospiraceae bacterium]|nr:hypothetical protein [Candidatus Vicinibacter affinis]MBK9639904.1 hypothetical protein [Candidatus Vicinibacter affinis]
MPSKSIGIIMIVVGVLMIGYTSFIYVTTERIVDIGPVKIDGEKKHQVQWSPIAGVVLLVGGVAFLFFSKKSST